MSDLLSNWTIKLLVLATATVVDLHLIELTGNKAHVDCHDNDKVKRGSDVTFYFHRTEATAESAFDTV